MLGAFAAVALAVMLVVSCGILLESSLRAPIPVERLAAAGVVVQADQTFDGNASVLLVRAEAAAGRRRRAPAGACRASEQRSPTDRFRSRPPTRTRRLLTGRDGTSAVGHGWSSARLTPRVLASGRPPGSATEVVLAADVARRASIRVGDRIGIADRHDAGELHGGRHRSHPPGATDDARSARLLPGRRRPTHLRHRQPSRPDRTPADAWRRRSRRGPARRRRAEGQRSAGADRSAERARRSPRRTPWDARTRSRV